MDYTIKHVATERELDEALALDKRVFGVPSSEHSPAYSRERWLERMKEYGDLMLYVESGGAIIGIVFGGLDNGGVTVGPVAVDEGFRKLGVARALMLELEKHVLGHGIHNLALGAVESAEGFYQKLGYIGTLLVQSEKHSIDELLALNTDYPVISTNVYQGTVSQVYLNLPAPDREFQRKCEQTLPGCGTQMVFKKRLEGRTPSETYTERGQLMNNRVMDWWNSRSDEYYGDVKEGVDMILDKAERAFPAVVWDMIKHEFPDIRGKRVLVPSSGDNIAAFGFHLLGASVTSCDISERQLHNAKTIAGGFGWSIEFIRQDSMKLESIPDGSFDLVYTSNGVHVWISDLPGMYGNFRRVLKPGGRYIMFETHPFIRPFDDSGPEIRLVKPYEDTGPFVSEEITEFGWRIMDLFNAVINSGFAITHMEEFHPQKGDYDNWFYKNLSSAAADNYRKLDWRINTWAALPQWIGLSAVRK